MSTPNEAVEKLAKCVSYIDYIRKYKWSVSYNDRIGKWVVQEQHQVCGCISANNDLEASLDEAITHAESKAPPPQRRERIIYGYL